MDVLTAMVELHRRLRTANVPHAFGGALALAYCTEMARGTIDVDLNLFLDPANAEMALAALPAAIPISDDSRFQIEREGQVRLKWDDTYVNLFFNTTDFHEAASRRVRWEEVRDHEMPFLDCFDVAVFKAMFNRTKDWADLEAMHAAGTLDKPEAIRVLTELVGPDDERIERIRTLPKAT